MENGHDEIEDDIFDNHLNDIDERETPRWEMSEEEPDRGDEETQLLSCGGLWKQEVKQGPKPNKTPETVQNGHAWDDDSDSIKDYCASYRKQEAKYMERTDEEISKRAAAEHIRQPIPYDDVDSVKNFGGASQGVSRIPSEEELCLSPPWPPGYEVDDGIALENPQNIFNDDEVAEGSPPEVISYHVDDIISRAKMQADARIEATSWQEVDAMDFTRNYAEEGSLENSRRPSSEDISLTPPWLDTDKESSCKDPEEQVIDGSELPSANPPTTSSILTSTPTTAHTLPSKPELSTIAISTPNKIIPSATNPDSPASTQNLKRTPSIPPVPSSMSETRTPQRRTPQAASSDRKNVLGVNPLSSSRPPQIRPYGDLYGNRYPAPRKTYPENDPYGANDPYMNNLGYTGSIPFGNCPPNTCISYPVPRSDFLQPPNMKPYQGAPFNTRQFRPNSMRPQGMPNRPPLNPTNPSYSNISHPYPKGYYDPTRMQPSVRPPRQAINTYDNPYYGPRSGNCQFKHSQMLTQPPARSADFAAEDEVINFAATSDRPKGAPAPDLHRNIPPAELSRGVPGPDVHRIPVSEFQRPEFRRETPAPDSRRGIPTREHQRTVPEYPINLELENSIFEKSHFSDFSDEVTTVSDSDVSPKMSTRSGSHSSQSSLAVYCNTPHRDGIETASVMSFKSGASTHQDLDSQIDQVRNLLAVIDTQDAKETAQTLYSLSSSKENCQAMRLSGCLPLLIQLHHKPTTRDPRVGYEVRVRSAQAMRNIIAAGAQDKRGKRERRVLKLIDIVRGYSVEVRFARNAPSSSKLRALDTALAAIMKLSFEEEHRSAIGDLGGVEAIGEFLELCYVIKDGNLALGANIRKYASMTLTNMTFEKTRSKALLGNSPGIVKALLKNLTVFNDEDLTQVSASVLRNLSCKSDERSKLVLQECNAVSALMTAAQKISGESTLRTILFAVWNLSAHSSQNKVQICETHDALGFLVEMMAYKSPSNSLSVVESSGGILRNLSSQIAVKSEYRAMLRDHECCKVLLACLRSPSLRVVGNACGILWNLSARCEQDQDILVKLGALALLKPLVTSKNKSIAKGAGAAIKNLQNYKASNPGRDSPSETRKQNGILRHENGSPSQARSKGRLRDAHSLNSFTGSADDVTKENGRQRTKENGESEPTREKAVRWSDDKRAGKDLRKTSSSDRKRGDSPPEEQQALINGASSSRDMLTRDGTVDVTSSIVQLNIGEKSPRIGEKSRGKKSDGSYSSPRSKKKSSSSKSKKHTSAGDDVGNVSLRLSQESQLNRSLNSSRLAKHSGKQIKDDNGLRNSPKTGRNSSRSARTETVEENNRDIIDDKVTRVDLASQRCQCADESEVWVKRSKFCNQCQKRRISQSSESTSGSRQSSYESLSLSNRQLNRKEPSANGTVTTL